MAGQTTSMNADTTDNMTLPAAFDPADTSTPWLQGRVPAGYWDDIGNRRRYLAWLGRRCGFESPEDWYGIRQKHFKKNCGGGLLANQYGFSVQAAVRELMPTYPWQPWLFGGVPQRYWQDAANRRRYMDWLGGKLGFRTEHDWYSITKRSFYKHCGGGLLANYYNDSPQQALHEYRPDVDWKPWLFQSVPQSFWQQADNRKQYMDWLANRLGYDLTTDWYSVHAADFYANGGGGLLTYYYGGSVGRALRDYRPDYCWEPERFGLAHICS